MIKKDRIDMKKAADQDRSNDHSDDESLRKAAQRCRENRKRLMRRKALQSESPEEKSRKLTGIGEDEERERIARYHIRYIVEFERQKLEMEKKRRREQSGVGDRDGEGEETPRKPESSSRFQDSRNSKIGVEESEPGMAPETKNRMKKRATERGY